LRTNSNETIFHRVAKERTLGVSQYGIWSQCYQRRLKWTRRSPKSCAKCKIQSLDVFAEVAFMNETFVLGTII
jgi:hypothetical protein